MTDENVTPEEEALPIQLSPKDMGMLISADTARVQRHPLVQSGEYFTLRSEDTADGLTRLLMPMDCSDEEFAAAEQAMREHDQELEALKRIKEFTESFEDDEEVIARCRVNGDNEEIYSKGPSLYKPRGNDGWSQGYWDEETGEGVDRFNGNAIVVKLVEIEYPEDHEWSEEDPRHEWVQVDPWYWEYKNDTGWQRVEA